MPKMKKKGSPNQGCAPIVPPKQAQQKPAKKNK